jgi:RNA polymerase sigma-54 factor
MELVDLVREEMMENPVLEDALETGQEQSREREEVGSEGEGEQRLEHAGETELAAPDTAKLDKEIEVKGNDTAAVNEIDWDNYLENYTLAPPMPSYRANNEELPSLESTLTKRPSLFDHLAWQLKLSPMGESEQALGMMIIGNLDADGYLKDPPLEEIAADARVPCEYAASVLKRIQQFDPIGVAARTLEECLLIQAEYVGADDELVIAMIKGHLSNLEKKNYQAIARDLKVPLEEIIDAARVICEFDPRPGRQYSSDVYSRPGRG